MASGEEKSDQVMTPHCGYTSMDKDIIRHSPNGF